MKQLVFLTICNTLLFSCHPQRDKEIIKKEIFDVEKAFEQMASEKGISEAFYYFAADSAIIKRENDTLIQGRENIRKYYEKADDKKNKLNWTPDFIEVSECGTLAWTYGKYNMKIKGSDDTNKEYKGIFHTIWKKQKDNTWKFVWD